MRITTGRKEFAAEKTNVYPPKTFLEASPMTRRVGAQHSQRSHHRRYWTSRTGEMAPESVNSSPSAASNVAVTCGVQPLCVLSPLVVYPSPGLSTYSP